MKYKDEVDYTKSKICQTCGKVFYKKKCLSLKEWNSRKYCSWSCRRPKFDKKKKSIYRNAEFYIKCFNCGKFFTVKRNNEFERRKFCSKSCAASFRAKTGEFKRLWTTERREKKREKQKRLFEEGKWKNPIYMPGVVEKIKNTKRKNDCLLSPPYEVI